MLAQMHFVDDKRHTNLFADSINVSNKGDSRVCSGCVRGIDPDIGVPAVGHDARIYATGLHIFRKRISQPHVLLRPMLVARGCGECRPRMTVQPVYGDEAIHTMISSFFLRVT